MDIATLLLAPTDMDSGRGGGWGGGSQKHKRKCHGGCRAPLLNTKLACSSIFQPCRSHGSFKKKAKPVAVR